MHIAANLTVFLKLFHQGENLLSSQNFFYSLAFGRNRVE
jgi:hypothetical protein